jgi:hypothetical protein
VEPFAAADVCIGPYQQETPMKGIIGWMIGIPIPVIILLYLLDVF